MTASAIFDIKNHETNLFVATGDGVVTVVDVVGFGGSQTPEGFG